jgi:hypothetical protein
MKPTTHGAIKTNPQKAPRRVGDMLQRLVVAPVIEAGVATEVFAISFEPLRFILCCKAPSSRWLEGARA